MKKLIALYFLFAFVVSCSSNDDTVAEEEENTETPQEPQEPVNPESTMKPSKISLLDKYWLFEYDENRVTSVTKFDVDLAMHIGKHEFYYSSMNELDSIIYTNSLGNNSKLNYVFENGLVKRFVKNSYNSSASFPFKDTVNYFYNGLNNINKIKTNIWYTPDINATPHQNGKATHLYTYDANGNVITYTSADENEGNMLLQFTYYYNDKNHPFKNIDPRIQAFFQLPTNSYNNTSDFTPISNDAKPGFNVVVFSALSSFNDLTFLRRQSQSAYSNYSFTYNTYNFPTESQENVLAQRLKIEYTE